MDSRQIACLVAASVFGLVLTAAATGAGAKPQRDIVVEGQRIDPELQRTVSYADLNLAKRPDRRVLRGRIYRTAGDLCSDLNGVFGFDECRDYGVRSTHSQVARAIARAERQMAGLPVGPPLAISMVIGVR